MSANSKIEWCHHTFNPWEGCTMVSPGCANCYAEARNARFGGGRAPNWGKGAPRRRTSQANWNLPLKWNREAAACGTRPRVFCASLADWLDEEAPIEWLLDLLELIGKTPNLEWLLLTKRPQNWWIKLNALFAGEVPRAKDPRYRWAVDWLTGESVPDNVWIGTTVEDKTRADQRIPELMRIPAKVRFLSCEPLLGVLGDMVRDNLGPCFSGGEIHQGIDWVICGGESGPGARPMHPEWARSLRDQCGIAGVPFFFKQWGEFCPADSVRSDRSPFAETWRNNAQVHHCGAGEHVFRVGKKRAGRLLDGIEHNAFPEGCAE